MSLNGRVAAITGASSGIGLATAVHLAREGVAVVLGARRTAMLESTAEQIVAAGGRAAVSTVDVAREEEVEALVATATREFGRLDIMICNAGFGYYGTLEDTPPDVMQRMMDVNYMGTFYGARAALPIFRAQGSGHLIFVSSIVGRRGIAFMGGYTATKAAQAGLAESPRHQRPRPEPAGGRRGAGDRPLRETAAPGGVSARGVARADADEPPRAGLHRSLREEVRPPPRCGLSRFRPAAS
jgi:NAD(P)-dependent dehydrogenase (short-subunit alcohol dehydrogenase family)